MEPVRDFCSRPICACVSRERSSSNIPAVARWLRSLQGLENTATLAGVYARLAPIRSVPIMLLSRTCLVPWFPRRRLHCCRPLLRCCPIFPSNLQRCCTPASTHPNPRPRPACQSAARQANNPSAVPIREGRQCQLDGTLVLSNHLAILNQNNTARRAQSILQQHHRQARQRTTEASNRMRVSFSCRFPTGGEPQGHTATRPNLAADMCSPTPLTPP